MSSWRFGQHVAPDMYRCAALAALLFCTVISRSEVVLTEGTNLTIDVGPDGRIAMDLLGSLWVLPARGGVADALDVGLLPAERPRWSPDGTAIVYQVHAAEQRRIALHSVSDAETRPLSGDRHFDQHPDWHPDGERIVYSSDRYDTGFDLWELDLPTGLTWRISSRPGDETEPAWSADGRHLIYINRDGDTWYLMLRRHGQPDEIVVESTTKLSAPSWRPDGSLISFVRQDVDGVHIDIAVLSDPPLVRRFISDGDIFESAVSWPDRTRMLYAANGAIMARNFDSWTSNFIPFSALVRQQPATRSLASRQRQLPKTSQPGGSLTVRTGRLFDGTGDDYQIGMDIVIKNGRVAELLPRDESLEGIVVDMGDLTALPGFIDSFASLPEDATDTLGPIVLSYGVTTMLVDHPRHEQLTDRWSGRDLPGPRLLPVALASSDPAANAWLIVLDGAFNEGVEWRKSVTRWQSRGLPVLAKNWRVALGSGATLLLGATSLPASPAGRRYADLELVNGAGPVRIVSALADSRTPGVRQLLASRQANLAGRQVTPRRRFAETPRLSPGGAMIAGSKPSGLPPGIALQAELRALVDAGLTPAEALRSATYNAATALGVDATLGRIATGAIGDLIIVDGDPLRDVTSAANIVAVVKNGRFFSAIGLIEKARPEESVE